MFERALELSGGVAGLLEVLKPYLAPFKDHPWYDRLIWALAFLFATAGAWLYNVNILHERADVHELFGYVLTGAVCSLGSEAVHRLLEIWRGLSARANTIPVPTPPMTKLETPAAMTAKTEEVETEIILHG